MYVLNPKVPLGLETSVRSWTFESEQARLSSRQYMVLNLLSKYSFIRIDPRSTLYFASSCREIFRIISSVGFLRPASYFPTWLSCVSMILTHLPAAEHDALARATKLKWPGGVSAFANDKRYPVKCVKFNPTRLTIRNIPEYHYLTFNEIVPLAGDFFTTKDYQPIAYGLEPGKGDEKAGEWYEPKISMRGRFEQSVKNLAEDQDGTLFWCIENIDSDMSTVEHAQHEHKHESHVYFAGGVDRSHKITGTSYWMWSVGPSHYPKALSYSS